MKHYTLPILVLAASLLAACGLISDIERFETQSKINNVILIVQENHSFDSYFGQYCLATPGSNPTCTTGRDCCEAAPAAEPKGSAPLPLDDAAHRVYDPDHSRQCMEAEINGGLMDSYVTGSTCADPRNFSIAADDLVKPYWDMADQGALAVMYFQPVAGQSSDNDMYFAAARYKFSNNAFKPDFAGKQCSFISETTAYTEPMLGDLLDAANVPWKVYAEGLKSMRAMNGNGCPAAPDACGLGLPVYPCVLDPSDIPFAYYPSAPTQRFADFAQLAIDLDSGDLPAFSFVKLIGYKTEHPGNRINISDGVKAVHDLVSKILNSPYKDDTLILITWDESGGYFDHVPPPTTSTVDGVPYGPRVPMIALGSFAASGRISHIELEHSSIVKFIEWNYLKGKTGQLGARDAVVYNIGSLLDPDTTGTIPE